MFGAEQVCSIAGGVSLPCFSNQHANKVSSHKMNADQRKNRNKTQMMFTTPGERVNNNDDDPGRTSSASKKTFSLQPLETPPTLPRQNNNKLRIEDKVTAATALLVMKGVEGGWSYSSMETLPAVCAKADPESSVWNKVTLSRNKNSYIVSHGLYPHFHEILVNDLRSSPGFSLLVDAATFKHQGLSQHCELKVRFWSRKFDEVCDAFLTYNTVGHETADIQVNHIKNSLANDGLTLENVIQLSRDSPNVMKSLYNKLKIEASAAGNSKLLDAPCYLHSVHNAFRKGVLSLTVNLSDTLEDLFGFFKHSTARREDVTGVRMELSERVGEDFSESLTQFYLRHVESRWLEMQQCLVRLVSLWGSSVDYLLTYLPNSKSSADKKTMTSERYQRLATFFRGVAGLMNKLRVKFLIVICKIFRPFLIILQSEKPLAQELWARSVVLFKELVNLVVMQVQMKKNSIELANMKLDSTTLEKSENCQFGPIGSDDDMSKLSSEAKCILQKEFQTCIVEILK